jgi:GGDEF domain-containing protein
MTAWVTLAISLTALAASAVTLLTVRSRARARARSRRTLEETLVRLAVAMAKLDDGLARLSGEARLAAALGELAEAFELEDALVRLADAAMLVSGAQSAVVRAIDADGRVVVGATHPATDLTFATEIEWPPSGARALTFTFLRDRDARGQPSAGSGLALPVCDESGSPIALVSVLFDEPERAARAVPALEGLAARAAPVVAALLAAAPTAHTREEPTGLHARDVFHETLARETSRARVHGTPLAVLLLDVGRAPHADIGSTLTALAHDVKTALAPDVVVSRLGSHELGLVLPGATRRDAELLVARVEAERSGRERDHGVGGFTTGAAELMLTDDAISLFERATKSLHTAKARSARTVGPDVPEAHGQP